MVLTDPEDILKMFLKSPQYVSFQWLADTMTDLPCSVPGAVKIKILYQGDGPMIPPTSVVKVHYAVYREHDRLPFAITKKGKYKKIHLGSRLCMEGLKVAITNVRGPAAHLLALLQPQVMWKFRAEPTPAEPVLFVIAVEEFQPHKVFPLLEPEQKAKYEIVAATVQYLRDKAKGFFQNQLYERAGTTYDRALEVMTCCCPKNEDEFQGIKDLELQLLVNAVVVYYKLREPKSMLRVCTRIDKCINIETHCKALFYKGRAYEMLEQYEEALEQYNKALKLESNNKVIFAARNSLVDGVKSSKAVEADMWRNAFNKLKLESENKTEEKSQAEAIEMYIDSLECLPSQGHVIGSHIWYHTP